LPIEGKKESIGHLAYFYFLNYYNIAMTDGHLYTSTGLHKIT